MGDAAGVPNGERRHDSLLFVQGENERSYPKKESHTEENRKRVRKCNNFDLYWNRKFINHFSAT